MKYEQFEVVCEREEVQFRGSMNKISFDGYYKVSLRKRGRIKF